MASVDDTAQLIIREFIKAASEESRLWLTYGELAARIGRQGQANLLQAPLDRARVLCRQRKLPDIPSMIVSKTSVLSGTLLPADGAILKYGGYHELRRLQADVVAFDWEKLRANSP